MRKLVALLLVVAMMLTLMPVAFAATYLGVQVKSNTYTYYDADAKKVTGATQNGGITYVFNKFANFSKWQVPGNVLTGAENTYNTWIHVVDTIIVDVDYDITNDTVYIDGYPYAMAYDSTIGYKVIKYSFYTLPVAGGTTVTRQLALYTSGGTLVGKVQVSVVYQDLFNIKGSVMTQGINQANTYASIKDDKIIVQVVYSNLVPKMDSTNATKTGYSKILYYPIEVLYTIVDKDGNPYPDFTRVDIVNQTGTYLATATEDDLNVVANQTGWFYLMDSKMKLIKHFSPLGTQGTKLEKYQDAAMLYSGLQPGVYASRIGEVSLAPIISEPGNGFSYEFPFNDPFRWAQADWAEFQNVLDRQASWTHMPRGWASLDNTVVSAQTFNEYRIYSWTNDDVGVGTVSGIHEAAVQKAIDYAIEAYYTDPANDEVFGFYAHTPFFALNLGTSAPNNGYRWVTNDTRIHLATYDTSWWAARRQGNDSWKDKEFRAIAEKFASALNTLIGTTYSVDAQTPSASSPTGYVDFYELAEFYYGQLRNNVPDSAYRRVSSIYSEDKVELIWNLMTQTQHFYTSYNTPSTVIEAAVYAAKEGYRASVTTALKDSLQPNSDKMFNELDKIEVTLTTPAGVVSRQTITVQYDSVNRIEAKKLTSLEGQTVTMKVGETKDVTVKAYQDQLPVTGLPIKFNVIDNPNVASATSPDAQNVNNNTTTITAKEVGTAVVRAYLDTVNDKAETFIIVNVVADTPAAPETTDFVCKVRKLWIRSGPGTSNSKLGFFQRNDIAKVYEVVNGWAKIDYNGGIAYSSTGDGKYLSPK